MFEINLNSKILKSENGYYLFLDFKKAVKSDVRIRLSMDKAKLFDVLITRDEVSVSRFFYFKLPNFHIQKNKLLWVYYINERGVDIYLDKLTIFDAKDSIADWLNIELFNQSKEILKRRLKKVGEEYEI